ncbi:hypothetical protein Pse7367_2557 [Thalassoporum mexicanum PCC 7367]|uniref:hypothetical protein n=1 Tax=Thalassoporum mexicanum TaxID=3457544 RepID=UPI00029FFD9E|nr:hypothetical protein [Pseudanabaena sp. PCC 7367]AFY70815.1 hypothetical protein Pse7367_2557 [Pseudanabaena sp. PCC 7367]
MDELQPIFQELISHPLAFMGGLTSGLLRLNLDEDPLKSWLQDQGVSSESIANPDGSTNGNGKGPQSIEIE